MLSAHTQTHINQCQYEACEPLAHICASNKILDKVASPMLQHTNDNSARQVSFEPVMDTESHPTLYVMSFKEGRPAHDDLVLHQEAKNR